QSEFVWGTCALEQTSGSAAPWGFLSAPQAKLERAFAARRVEIEFPWEPFDIRLLVMKRNLAVFGVRRSSSEPLPGRGVGWWGWVEARAPRARSPPLNLFAVQHGLGLGSDLTFGRELD